MRRGAEEVESVCKGMPRIASWHERSELTYLDIAVAAHSGAGEEDRSV